MDREDIKMLVKKWWDIYNDESLDYDKGRSGVVEGGAETIKRESLLAAMSEAGQLHCIAAPSAA